MRDQVRGDNINSLLTRILQRRCQGAPVAVILEDAHWLDSASWALTAQISRELHPALLLIVTRPMEPPDPQEFFDIVERKDAHSIPLSQLSPDDTLQLVCQRLGVARLPAEVRELVTGKAEGNPFFAEEVAYSLRDSGALVVEAGKARLAEAGMDLDELGLPACGGLLGLVRRTASSSSRSRSSSLARAVG